MKMCNYQILENQKIQDKVIIGFFDIIHKGHYELFKNHIDASVITFKNIPHKSLPLNSLETRVSNLMELGFKNIYVFDIVKNNMSALSFVQKYLLNTKAVIVGSNFVFGNDHLNIGSFSSMINLCLYPYNEEYSTSIIKNLLKNGEIEKVNNLLISEFSISHIVNHGNKIGRQIGFPTANFNFIDGSYLASGIYLTKTLIDEKWYKSVTVSIKDKQIPNIKCDVIETHVIDFIGNLYDKEITVKFIDHLGNMVKPKSMDDLTNIIKSYVDKVRNMSCF
ncbi:MAG: riboflavin kinase [Mycoplasma sp.]